VTVSCFHVEVRDDDIIVALPASGFCAIYSKLPNQPQLFLKCRTETEEYELLARAWQAANTKARELGWVV